MTDQDVRTPGYARYDGRGVYRGVEVCPQPSPQRNEGGDCFACAFIAAYRKLFHDMPVPTFEDTDRWFTGRWAGKPGEEQEAGVREGPTDNTWTGLQNAITKAKQDGYEAEWTTDMVVPEWDHRRWGFGWAWQNVSRTYARRLEAWLSAGWLAFTVVNFDGSGPITPDGRFNTTDHFVLLDGVREREDDPYWNDPEIHVVCSAKGPYWIGCREFVTLHGGQPLLLLRRLEPEDQSHAA